MNYHNLRVELDTGHPDTGAYSLDNEIAATELNLVNRTRNRVSLTPSEIYNSVDQDEWLALSAEQQQEVWDILHLGNPLNPFGREADRFIAIFGLPIDSTTTSTLQSVRVENISRAQELGFPPIKTSDVDKARAL